MLFATLSKSYISLKEIGCFGRKENCSIVKISLLVNTPSNFVPAWSMVNSVILLQTIFDLLLQFFGHICMVNVQSNFWKDTFGLFRNWILTNFLNRVSFRGFLLRLFWDIIYHLYLEASNSKLKSSGHSHNTSFWRETKFFIIHAELTTPTVLLQSD